jgi:hypothetical protein
MTQDLRIEHTYRKRNSTHEESMWMNPYRNQKTPHAGLYDIARTAKNGSANRKYSSHVTLEELAELYARGLVDSEKLRLRLTPSDGTTYPIKPPRKYLPSGCLVAGSRLDNLIQRSTKSGPFSPDMLRVLGDLGLSA